MSKYENGMYNGFNAEKIEKIHADNIVVILLLYILATIFIGNALISNCILIAGLFMRYIKYNVNPAVSVVIILLGAYFEIPFSILLLIPTVIKIKEKNINWIKDLALCMLLFFLPVIWL